MFKKLFNKRLRLSFRKAKQPHDAWQIPKAKLWGKWLLNLKINWNGKWAQRGKRKQ